MRRIHLSTPLTGFAIVLVLTATVGSLVAHNYTVQNYFNEVQGNCYNKRQQAFDFSCEKLLLFRSIIELTERNYKWNLLGDNDTLVAVEKNQDYHQGFAANLDNLTEIERVNEFIQSQWNKFLHTHQLKIIPSSATTTVQEQGRGKKKKKMVALQLMTVAKLCKIGIMFLITLFVVLGIKKLVFGSLLALFGIWHQLKENNKLVHEPPHHDFPSYDHSDVNYHKRVSGYN